MELVEWNETMHLQNTNGREKEEEMFRLGIEAAIEELTEFNLFSIPVVVGMLCDHNWHHLDVATIVIGEMSNVVKEYNGIIT